MLTIVVLNIGEACYIRNRAQVLWTLTYAPQIERFAQTLGGFEILLRPGHRASFKKLLIDHLPDHFKSLNVTENVIEI